MQPFLGKIVLGLDACPCKKSGSRGPRMRHVANKTQPPGAPRMKPPRSPKRETAVADQLDTTAFPTLSQHQLQRLEELGAKRSFADGEHLFREGDRDYSFFAITSGQAVVVETSSGQQQTVVTHEPGHFTGDVSMLTGRPAVVSIRAVGGCTAIEILPQRLRQMLAEIPCLSDLLIDAFQVRRQLLEQAGFVGVRVIGANDDRQTLRLREFFYKNRVPHTYYDTSQEEGRQALQELDKAATDTPVIQCSGHVVSKPSLADVAECLSISRRIPDELYDTVIIGAGPAGLAAAVYGASEGLATLCVDGMGPGGQAAQSSRIENYMGFPAGLSGADLANRGYLQALKFGAQFTAPVTVQSLAPEGNDQLALTLCTGQRVRSRTVVVATGVSYRRLPVDGCERLEGAGVYYSATSVEARHCRDAVAVVIGGGNSAGQAAMYLAQHASRVKMLLRGGNLRSSMSDYLASRIERTDNIDVLTHTELTRIDGQNRLQQIQIGNNQTGHSEDLPCVGVFIFVGARPHTEWLPDSVALDERGFITTGPEVQHSDRWPLERTPCELETTMPGVFAAGDVRSGTTKRCAFAVGDGALAITCVHQHLRQHA